MVNNLLREHHPVKQAKRFRYAFEGIWHALLNEANFRVQVIYAILATLLGIYLQISPAEWGTLILSMGFLLSAEMSNTAIEAIMDHMMPDFDPRVKVVKDLSAGFVLVAGVTVLLISGIIFVPKLYSFYELSMIAAPSLVR